MIEGAQEGRALANFSLAAVLGAQDSRKHRRECSAEFLPSCLDRNAVGVFCVEILAPAEGAWNAGKSSAYIYIFRPDVQTKYGLLIFDGCKKRFSSFSGQLLGSRKVQHPGAEPERLRKNGSR